VEAHCQKFWCDENPGKNPLKSGQNQNLCNFGQNVWKPSRNRFVCFDFTKMAPELKVQTFLFLEVMFLQFFFVQVRGNLGKFGGNLGKNGAWSALIQKKCAQNGMKCNHFLRSFSLEFFSGKLREVLAKSFAPQKFACSYTYERLWAFRACTDCKR